MDIDVDKDTFEKVLAQAGISSDGEPVSAVWHPSGFPVFKMAGRMHGLSGDGLIRLLQPVWDACPGNLIIDMSACEYMSSSTLGFLVNTALERFEQGAQFFLCQVRREIQVLFAHMDVDQFFRITPSVDEAIAMLLSLRQKNTLTSE